MVAGTTAGADAAKDRGMTMSQTLTRFIFMVKVTSPAARIPLEKGPEMGKATA